MIQFIRSSRVRIPEGRSTNLPVKAAAREHERFSANNMARSARIQGIVINQISLVMFPRVSQAGRQADRLLSDESR